MPTLVLQFGLVALGTQVPVIQILFENHSNQKLGEKKGKLRFSPSLLKIILVLKKRGCNQLLLSIRVAMLSPSNVASSRVQS